MHAAAAKKGGRFLSPEYLGGKIKHVWQCGDGHEPWMSIPSDILNRNSWCPKCAILARRKHDVEKLKNFAAEKGGECLSKEYLGFHEHHEWRCASGHNWPAKPSKILSGQWCPYCAQKRSDLPRYEKLAKQRGGSLLSRVYLGSTVEHQWRCSGGHVFMLKPERVVSGRWCSQCHYEKIALSKLESMKEFARQRGGDCLASSCQGDTRKALWQCGVDPLHTWIQDPSSVKAGAWCPHCSGRIKPIERYQSLAAARGGECLEQSYRGSSVKHLWRCARGHEWKALPDNIEQGRWCPECSGKNPLGLQAMIDFAEKRGGSCLSKTYKNSEEPLSWQCYAGHEWTETPRSTLAGSWCPNCRRRGGDAALQDPKWQESIGMFYEDGGASLFRKNRVYGLKDMVEVARFRGGECLSESYLGMGKKLHWRCSMGHEWSRSPVAVINKEKWCPECEAISKLEKLKDIAKGRGGVCLSEKFNGTAELMKWRCVKSHEWMANADTVTRGHWCGKCVGLGKSIEDARSEAAKHGGDCMSSAYVDSQVKMKWSCGKHVFEMSYNSVQSGHWCPDCRNKGEAFLRQAIQELTGAIFVKNRPEWLRQKNGCKLELDGYNESLGLAFEYQGAQHHRFIPFFHGDESKFEHQKKKDAFKVKACKKNKVFLLVVNQIDSPSLNRMRQELIRVAHKIGLDLKKMASLQNEE